MEIRYGTTSFLPVTLIITGSPFILLSSYIAYQIYSRESTWTMSMTWIALFDLFMVLCIISSLAVWIDRNNIKRKIVLKKDCILLPKTKYFRTHQVKVPYHAIKSVHKKRLPNSMFMGESLMIKYGEFSLLFHANHFSYSDDFDKLENILSKIAKENMLNSLASKIANANKSFQPTANASAE